MGFAYAVRILAGRASAWRRCSPRATARYASRFARFTSRPTRCAGPRVAPRSRLGEHRRHASNRRSQLGAIVGEASGYSGERSLSRPGARMRAAGEVKRAEHNVRSERSREE